MTTLIKEAYDAFRAAGTSEEQEGLRLEEFSLPPLNLQPPASSLKPSCGCLNGWSVSIALALRYLWV